MKKTKAIYIRVTEADLTEMRRRASELGLSLTEFIIIKTTK